MSETRGELVTLIRSWRTWGIACALVFVGVVCWHLIGPYRVTIPPEALPWHVEFGRGGGGVLGTVRVGRDGTVLVYRLPAGACSAGYTVATLKLPPVARAELLAVIERENLLGLRSKYVDEMMTDGRKWALVLRLDRPEGVKTIYCSNEFPPELERFAKALDRVLDENGLANLTWHHASPDDGNGQSRAMLDAVGDFLP
jgi:hypothetical protein